MRPSDGQEVVSMTLFQRMLLAGLWLCAMSCVAFGAPSPKMLVEAMDLSGLAISPDGQFVAFRQEQASVERNTYDSVWMVEALDGRTAARRLADGGLPLRYDMGAAVNEPPQWSPDGHWIYYRALLGGEVQVWRAAVDGSRAETVTHDEADVAAFTLSKDGRRLIYTVGATRHAIQSAEVLEYDQGVLIDGTVPLGQGVYRSGFINGRLSTQRFMGDWMERRGLLAGAPSHHVVVDLTTQQARPAKIPEDLKAFADVLPVTSLKAAPDGMYESDHRVRSPTDGAIAFVEQSGSTTALRVTSSADDPNSTLCAATACKDAAITALAWRRGHDEVVFTTLDRDRGRAQSLYDWDIAHGEVRLIAHAAGLINGGLFNGFGEACAVAVDVATCVTASADEPPRLERIDLRTGARYTLYAPNLALAQAVGPRAQPLQWRDSQGQVFNGQFFPPATSAASGPAPLFITYYRCSGYLRGGLGDEWPLASLAGAGIAALCIDEPKVDPTHLDQVARYGTALSGVRSVITLLAGRGAIDPTRVGMGGLSFGSEVVLWTAMKSDLLAAASVTSTSVTPTYYQLHGLQGPTFQKTVRSMWGLGSPAETPNRWKALSPAFKVDKIHVPLLLQMPEQEYLSALDYVVPLANSPTPVELYVFPEEPHLKIQPRHKLAAYERNLDWFRFWLEGYVDPDPLKASQYQRWSAMRTRSKAAGLSPGRGSLSKPNLPN
jgi:dipeptidyl aminopeptidase/acylaminoacyl peptidase